MLAWLLPSFCIPPPPFHPRLLPCAAVPFADTVQVLVTLGADLKAKNQDGETAVAVGKRVETDKEVIEFLEQFMGLVDQD